MSIHRSTIPVAVLLLSLSVQLQAGRPAAARPDVSSGLVKELLQQVQGYRSATYSVPTDEDLQAWSRIVNLFRSRSRDTCRALLAKYHYVLNDVRDPSTGNVWEVIKEESPVRRGWGTFIRNPGHTKRLNLEVNHPVDDERTLAMSFEMFRRLNAEWLLIAGTGRVAGGRHSLSDVGRLQRSVFEQVHEMIGEITHISLSIHAFSENSYPAPIRNTGIILSNGKTSDEQWGISQISLTFRDTMRAAGYGCALAMYDSGYSKLAAGWNSQGVFSNDSLGFGHWLYVGLSKSIRERPSGYPALIDVMEHALELTGKKISQQVNRAFGLVSPRVVRVDSLHGIFFPPANGESYRIISFNSAGTKKDTIDVRMGNWVDLLGSRKSVTSVTKLDTGEAAQFRSAGYQRSRLSVSRIIEEPSEPYHSIVQLAGDDPQASAQSSEDTGGGREPLQVHRIPLHAVNASAYANQSWSPHTTFHWEGVMPHRAIPNVLTFQISSNRSTPEDGRESYPSFLIPIINSSYRTGKSGFIGVQMTTVLVNEIARLVSQYPVSQNDVGLLAEQSESGDYFLRIFPAGREVAGTEILSR